MHRLLLLLTALAACGRTVTVTDDFDLTWDFKVTPFDRYVDKLHSPYVRGTQLTIWVTSDDDSDKVQNWEVVSSDPGVLMMMDQEFDGTSLGVHALAVGEGPVDLAVIDDHGERVGHGKAEVALPDEVQLAAHGYLIVGQDDRAPVSEARIALNDTATYLVRYYQGGRELYGNSVLTATVENGVVAEPKQSYLFEKREWLSLTAGAAGPSTTQLLVDGTHISDVQVVSVPATDITDVAVIAQSEQGASNGQWLVVLAQATDTLGRNVFGVDYNWVVNGNAQTADGDLYRYQFTKGDNEVLEVERAGHTDLVNIQSDRGYVDNSNRVGCAAAGGGTLQLGVLALAWCVRRRRRRSATTPTSAPTTAVLAPPCARQPQP
jgi:hypothetical protein